jgi:hypothetical protein
MNKFKVTDPKGVFIDGKHHEKGGKVSIPEGAVLDAFLHFKQVSLLDDKSDDEGDAKAKAKAEAEAKAKAEADAKANK